MESLLQLWKSSLALRIVAIGIGVTLALAFLLPTEEPPAATRPAALLPVKATPLDKAKAWLPAPSSGLPTKLPGKLSDTVSNELARIDETAEITHDGINSATRLATKTANALLDALPVPGPPDDRRAP